MSMRTDWTKTCIKGNFNEKRIKQNFWNGDHYGLSDPYLFRGLSNTEFTKTLENEDIISKFV